MGCVLVLSGSGASFARAAPLPVAPLRVAPRPPAPRPRLIAAKRAQANMLLKAGSGKMEIGLYVEALSRFKAAYKLVPSPKIDYNIALAYNYLSRYVESLFHFERFERRFSDRSHKYWKATRSVWIPRLKRRIATVRVRVNVGGAAVNVAGHDAGVSPDVRAVRVQPEPGRLFVIVVTRTGYVDQTLKVRLRAGQHLIQRVTLISEAKALAQREEFRREQAERRRMQRRLERAQARALRQRIRRRKQLRLAGWITVGAGLAVGLAGGVVGIVSLVDRAWVEGAEAGRLFSELKMRYDRAELLRKVAWVGIGSGLVTAATGGILLWLSYRRARRERPWPGRASKPTVSVFPAIGPGEAGMTLRLQF